MKLLRPAAAALRRDVSPWPFGSAGFLVPWVERFEATLAASGLTEKPDTDWTEFAENVRRMRISTRPRTERRWLGVAGMFMLLALCGWLIWTMVVRDRLQVVRPGADVGAYQRSSGGSANAGNR